MSYKNRKSQTKKPQGGEIRFAKYIAKNALASTEKIYEGRRFYRNNAFETDFLKTKKPIDLWKQAGFLYGKVNFEEEPIYLNEYYLKQYKAVATIFGLAPVVDAYHDLIDFMKKHILGAGNAVIGSESIWNHVSVKKGWTSVNKDYSTYLQSLAVAFTSKYLTTEKEMKIVDFKSFLNIFTDFMTSGILGETPITLTGFVRSKWCNPRTSGLIVELFEAGHDRDPMKEGFLKDAGLNFWVATAEQFGFSIDKNAPWRLIANLSYSTAMAKKMSSYGVKFGVENMKHPFERFYKKVYDTEIPIMSHYLAELYNNYVNSRPTIAVASLKNYCLGGGRRLRSNYKKTTVVKTLRRAPLNCFTKRKLDPQSDYVKKYGELFWLRYYYSLRVLEEKKVFNDKVLNSFFKKRLLPYYRVHGLVATLRAINQDLVLAPADAPRVNRELKWV